ncbi:MAG: hypothetical protein V4750_02710 [Pseudomonadota bacterium]
MSLESIGPLLFGTKSLVTTSLGLHDGEVGQTHRDADGRLYRLIYNDGGASVPVGCGVVTAGGAGSPASVTVSAVTSADLVVGVCRHATITTAAYAWVVVEGVTGVQAMATSGTCVTFAMIEVAANGYGAPVSNTTGNKSPAFAKALTTIASSGTGDAYVRCF